MQYRSFTRLQAMHKQHGFTLLEMSIVVLIIGIMVASILPALTQQKSIENAKQLTQKMDKIEDALEAFRIKNDRLPCPAQLNLPRDNDDFGVEADVPGTCTGGTLSALATAAGSVRGVLPVKTLGLDDDMAYDPWDRAFSYHVDARITDISAYSTYPIDDIDIGSLTVRARDAIGGTLSDQATKAIAVVLSHGPNGHGARLPSGGVYNANASTGISNVDEQENCNCNATASTSNENAEFVTALDSTSVAGNNSGFDDILRYYTRGSFVAARDFDPVLTAGTPAAPLTPDTPTEYADFDGSNDYIRMGDIFYEDNFTISAWIRPTDATPTGDKYIVHKRNNAGGVTAGNDSNNEWAILMQPTGKVVLVAWQAGGSAIYLNVSTATLSDNTWHHIVGVFPGNGNSGGVYIDGVQDSTATATGFIQNTASGIQIGSKTNDDNDRWFDGGISDVRIYSDITYFR